MQALQLLLTTSYDDSSLHATIAQDDVLLIRTKKVRKRHCTSISFRKQTVLFSLYPFACYVLQLLPRCWGVNMEDRRKKEGK